MKRNFLLISLVALVFVTANFLIAEDAKKPQTKDPITNEDVIHYYFADNAGLRVYFSTFSSIEAFKKEPDKFIKKMTDEGIEVAKTPVPQSKCPVTDKPIDKQFFSDHDGMRIYFANAESIEIFKAEPAKYIKVLTDAGITPDRIPKPQTTCPVMKGNEITKKLFVDHAGYRIYFCCGSCPRAFKANPDKWMRILEADGFTLEPAPAK